MKALYKLYKEINNEPNYISDYENSYITENLCRNGRCVLWYMDSKYCKAIYVDTCEFLSDEEIENELC